MIRTHARAVAFVALAFLLAALIGVQAARAQPAPAGKIERGPIPKPAAAALVAPVSLTAPGKAARALAKPLRQDRGKVERGPIEK